MTTTTQYVCDMCGKTVSAPGVDSWYSVRWLIRNRMSTTQTDFDFCSKTCLTEWVTEC